MRVFNPMHDEHRNPCCSQNPRMLKHIVCRMPVLVAIGHTSGRAIDGQNREKRENHHDAPDSLVSPQILEYARSLVLHLLFHTGCLSKKNFAPRIRYNSQTAFLNCKPLSW